MPPYWSCAPGARTIRMCSLDGRSGTNKGGLTPGWLLIRRNVRSGGPSQAALLERENEQAWTSSIPNAHWPARLPPSGTWLPPARSGEPSVLRPHSCLVTPQLFCLKKYIDNYKCGVHKVAPTRQTGAVWLFGTRSDADPEPARSSSLLTPHFQFARTH